MTNKEEDEAEASESERPRHPGLCHLFRASKLVLQARRRKYRDLLDASQGLSDSTFPSTHPLIYTRTFTRFHEMRAYKQRELGYRRHVVQLQKKIARLVARVANMHCWRM